MTLALDTRSDGTRRRLLRQVGIAFVAGTLLTVLVVLPAEYNIDLTGFGALTGINRISAPQEIVVETRADAPPEIARASAVPFRSDTVTIRVPGLGEGFGALEYKVTAQAGDAIVYSWSASADLVYEFHGHTLATAEKPEIEVMNYMAGRARESHGTLITPIDGIHGWYLANPGFDPIEVELKLSGYYELEPGILSMR